MSVRLGLDLPFIVLNRKERAGKRLGLLLWSERDFWVDLSVAFWSTSCAINSKCTTTFFLFVMHLRIRLHVPHAQQLILPLKQQVDRYTLLFIRSQTTLIRAIWQPQKLLCCNLAVLITLRTLLNLSLSLPTGHLLNHRQRILSEQIMWYPKVPSTPTCELL